MAKHKSLKDAIREKEFRKMIADSLKQQYQRGLLVGSRAILKTFGDKIAEDGKTAEEKLTDIMKLVNALLQMTENIPVQDSDPIENPLDQVLGDADEEVEETSDADEPATEASNIVAINKPEDDDE